MSNSLILAFPILFVSALVVYSSVQTLKADRVFFIPLAILFGLILILICYEFTQKPPLH